MCSLSAKQRSNIIFMLQNGNSVHKIAAKLGVGKSTVGEVQSEMQSPLKENLRGHPSKLTQDCHYIIQLITTGKADTATQIHCHLSTMTNTLPSIQTIWNALKKEDLVAQVKVKKPFLSKKHRKAHLEFAQKYEYWTVEDWKHVMFTDETKINHIRSDGRQWVWKKQGSPLLPQHIQQTVKFNGGHIMI